MGISACVSDFQGPGGIFHDTEQDRNAANTRINQGKYPTPCSQKTNNPEPPGRMRARVGAHSLGIGGRRGAKQG